MSELGYYRYRGHVFLDKFHVLELALALRDYDPVIELVLPLAGDTRCEPQGSLTDLYAARARTLRDRYDYLILMYSGGADSDQVLMTFLRNGIRLDEVRTVYPMGFCERLPGSASTRDPLALLHEFRHAATIGLHLTRTLSPRTRIEVVDSTEAFRGDVAALWTTATHGPRVSAGTHGLYGNAKWAHEGIDLQRRADAVGRGRQVGVIYGADKPFMRLIGDELHLFFADAGRVCIEHVWRFGDRRLFDPVMFYWGDPAIPLKQAHVVRRALTPAAVDDIRRRGINVYMTNGIPGIDLGLIYPDWDWRFQQGDKSDFSAILPHFIGERAQGIAAERNRYLNARYGRLSVVNQLPDRPARRVALMKDTCTRLYPVGKVQCSAP